jgi:primosomal protein N' (replication factor Y)
LGGQVILQTFQPEHYVIQHAAQHDYAGFIEEELAYRHRLGYPPYARLVRLEYRHADPIAAQSEAEKMALRLAGWIKSGGQRATEIVGPTPCFYERIAGETRWQVILRGPDPAGMLAQHDPRELLGWRVEVNPQALL